MSARARRRSRQPSVAPLVPAVLMRRRDGQVWLSRDEADVLKIPLADGATVSVAESFAFAGDMNVAFDRCAGRRVALAAERLAATAGILDGSVEARCRVRAGGVSVGLPCKQTIDVTDISRETCGVLEAVLLSVTGGVPTDAPMSRGMFEALVKELVAAAVLSPRPGDVVFGDFRRCWPFSHRFGFDRGAPIDRYYLAKFLRAIHPRVRGRCLEIGGSLTNHRRYGFDIEEFRTLDLAESGVADDFRGDASDPSVFEASSWDSILAFHVLEHCPDPFAVVENMRAWLRPGGHAFIVVPCAQRLHNFPGDYWRFMPDGLKLLFKRFSDVTVSTYGNPLALVSSYLGLSHTELTTAEMEFTHPDYPVLACVVARK